MTSSRKNIKNLILDVDGVLNTGQFLYTNEKKFAKVFGPHDNDGIKLLSKQIHISAISADKKGFAISKKRVANDMGLKLTLVTEGRRLSWLQENFNLKESIYMGDGIYDAIIFGHVAYSIAPASAFYLAKNKASYVTKAKAGEGAVGEACIHIMEKFLEIPSELKVLFNK
jgi:3-deoxy-D-manno-octulosonate 8-phosphate phosphatase (KDO 8-P phosphatase)